MKNKKQPNVRTLPGNKQVVLEINNSRLNKASTAITYNGPLTAAMTKLAENSRPPKRPNRSRPLN